MTELKESVAAPELAEDVLEHPQISVTALAPGESVTAIEIDHEKAFADHVTMVRDQGDSLDAIRAYSSLTGRLAQKVATAAVAGEALANMPFGIWAALGSAAVVTGGKFAQGTVARRRAFKKAEHRLGIDAAELTGERYELYRIRNKQTKSHEVVMRWYGPQKDDEALAEPMTEHMYYVAKLAADNGVKAIMIAPGMLKDDRETARKHAAETVQLTSWLHDKKRFDISMDNQGDKHGPVLDVYTPQGLTALAGEFGRRPKDMTDLGTIVETLRLRQPNHPLVTQYDTYAKAPVETRRELLQRTARASLERRMDDVAAVLDRSGSYPVRLKQHLSGRLSGDQVTWLPDGQMHEGLAYEKTHLLKAIGLTAEQLDGILSNPETFSDRDVVRAMECAAYLHTARSVKITEQDTTAGMADESYLVQQKLVENTRQRIRGRTPLSPETTTGKTLLNSRYRKLARNVLVAVTGSIIAYAPSLAYKTADHDYEYALADSQNQLVHELHLKSNKDLTFQEYEEANERTLQEHPILRDYFTASDVVGEGIMALDSWMHGRQFQSFGDGPTLGSTSAPPTGLTSKAEGVGNVANSEPIPEWHLEPHGMSDEGYWAADVGSSYDQTGNWQDVPAENYDVPPVDFDTAAHPQYIRVTRQLVKESIADTIFQLPVLEGTKPVAVNFADREVGLTDNRDGVYSVVLGVKGVQLEGNGNNTLEYWLVPDENAGRPHVTKPTDFTGMDSRQQEVIRSTWNRLLADPSARGIARAQEEKDYIQQHFTYSLAPLDPQTASNMRIAGLGFDDFTLSVLKNQEANCNIAATLLTLDNPELGAAWGYNNQDADHQLMSTEAHMWTVDAAGDILDATPAAAQDSSSGTAVKNSQQNSDNSTTELLLAGTAVAAGAGAVGRRKLAAGYRSARLNTYSTRQLDQARQVANRAAFATDADPAKVLPSEEGLTRAKALKDLGAHSLHSEHVQASIDAALAARPNRATRRALKRARTVLRLVAKSGMAEQLTAPADISGLV